MIMIRRKIKVKIINSPKIYEPYDLIGRTGIIVNYNSMYYRQYSIELDCGLINPGSVYGTFNLNEKDFEIIEEEKEDMAKKLTGYYAVAVIEHGTGCCKKDYHYAIYNDKYTYKTGDTVYTSGNAGYSNICKIKDIITPAEAEERFKNAITAEVICPVDTTFYENRVEKRKEVEKLKKEMDKMIKQMDETKKYDMYATENPDLKKMLDEYKKLTGK